MEEILEGKPRKFSVCLVKHIVIVRASDRDAKVLVGSREIFHVLFWTHTYVLNYFVFIMHCDLRTMGSIGLYHRKHRRRT